MSWREDTVTCSHCWEQGHNRVGCAGRKKFVAESRAVPADDRTWRQIEAVKEDDKYAMKRMAPRHCSYCRVRINELVTGHNRRNCPALAADRLKLMEREKEFRPIVLEALIDAGFGVGAMVEWKDGWRGMQQGIITSVNWGAIGLMTRFSLFRHADWFTCTTANAQNYYLNAPKSITTEVFPEENWWRPEIEVLSPAPEVATRRLVPSEWHSGHSDLATIFFKARSDSDCYDADRWLRRDHDTPLDGL